MTPVPPGQLALYLDRLRFRCPTLSATTVEWGKRGQNEERLFPLMTRPAIQWTRDLFKDFLHVSDHAVLLLRLIHGDFGGSNILVDRHTGELIGVIDFSSAHLNDPAVDLAAASTVGPDFLQRVAHTYPVADTALPRVAFYRATFGLQEALFGVEAGDEGAVRAGLESIPGQ